MKDIEVGVDLHFSRGGHRILDDPLYRILSLVVRGDLDPEFLDEWGRPLFGDRLGHLFGHLGNSDSPEQGGLPPGLEEFLRSFDEKRADLDRWLRYGRPPALTVDGVVVRNGCLLLIRRGNEPFKGRYALPGGFVDYGERTEDAVVREVREETGLNTSVRGLVGVYSDPARDPRGHTVSVVYLLAVSGGEPAGGDDALTAEFLPLDRLPELAFDHDIVVKDALALLGMNGPGATE